MRRLCLPAIAASVSLLGLVAGTAAASASAPVAAPVVERNSAVCFSGCQLALQYVAFAGDDDVERGEKLSASPSAIDGPKLPALSVSDEAHVLRASGPCANSLARRALLRCAHEYCTPDVRDAGMRNVNATCVRRGLGGFGHVPLVSRPVGRVAFGQRGMWNTVVIPDADFFERAYFTEVG
ncbi:hypothetical protein BROUX41_002353 [Berkeleyomyces rouxiae]|uniref:uncharacterized protein n=1 Tax=Berkeleyomyces rouxiae TaxID=2035830 RepID=UPI003B7FA86F